MLRARRFDGGKLKALREARQPKMSQGELGRKIGAHVTSISDWERGDNAPSGRYVVALAAEFGVPAEHFFGDDEDEEAAQTMVDDLHLRAAMSALAAYFDTRYVVRTERA